MVTEPRTPADKAAEPRGGGGEDLRGQVGGHDVVAVAEDDGALDGVA
jgi:hypothetical protein